MGAPSGEGSRGKKCSSKREICGGRKKAVPDMEKDITGGDPKRTREVSTAKGSKSRRSNLLESKLGNRARGRDPKWRQFHYRCTEGGEASVDKICSRRRRLTPTGVDLRKDILAGRGDGGGAGKA